MKVRTQEGFSAPHVLLVLVIVGIVGFAGWRVYDAQKETNESLDNTSTANEVVKPDTQKKDEVDEEALAWKQITSRQGGFSVRIPDGFEVTNYAKSDSIRSEKLTHKPGTPVKVTEVDYAYAGDSIARLSIFMLAPGQFYNLGGGEEKSEFKLGDITGSRYYKKYPVQQAEGIGAYPGMEAYTYEFKHDGKTLYVTYNVLHDNQYIRQILDNFTEGDKNQVELIERMIRTLEIK